MKTLRPVALAFMYLQAWLTRVQQDSFILRPDFALTVKNWYPSSSRSRLMSFCASGEGSFFRSALLPSRILGTDGSTTSFTCSIQYSSPFSDLSSASENTMKMPSDPLKKFLATERQRSWPEVSQSSTSTLSPSIFLTWLLQSAPMVVAVFSLKEPSMMRSRMLVLPTALSPIRQVLIFFPINIQHSLDLNFIMLRPKHKFYELSEREKEGEKINDIYKLISQQEETMAQLLSKYQEKDARTEQYQQESRTIETSFHQTSPRGRSTSKIEHLTLQLPTISPNRTNKKRLLKKSKDKLNDLNPYFLDANSQKEKAQLRNHLQRAYGTERLRKSRSKSKVEASEKGDQIKKYQSERAREEDPPKEKTREREPAQNELPTPLGYFKETAEEESSSEEGEVPLNYYQREFRSSIRAQCLQETNFLYFSKNESMKDWTEGLLLLFEKHDKQLQSLRKKCKYLQKFDDNFFSIDIFKEG